MLCDVDADTSMLTVMPVNTVDTGMLCCVDALDKCIEVFD